MKIAIMQPYFMPYLGYFQLMASVDIFVLYDDVNFINRGWINRNRLNLNGSAHWLTIPLRGASQNRLIHEICISDQPEWRGKALKTIQYAYSGAAQYRRVFPLVESIIRYPTNNLAAYLHHSLFTLHEHLQLSCQIVATSRVYQNSSMKGKVRIIDICQREGAACYVNPIGGINLYDRNVFESHNLELMFCRPACPPYKTGNSPFLPGLSIIDVLMHNTPETVRELVFAAEVL